MNLNLPRMIWWWKRYRI